MTILHQNFQVQFSYNIIFTENLFSPENNTLLDFLQQYGNTNFRKKILFLIDEGVAMAHPHLLEQIQQYFAPQNAIELAEEILSLAGEG